MDKPINLSIKDFLIRKMSVKMNKQEDVLDAIISFQFKSANEAMKIHSSVEFSGFGKFIFNNKKAIKRLEKAYSQKELFERYSLNSDFSEIRRNSYKLKLKNIEEYIETLIPKIKYEENN